MDRLEVQTDIAARIAGLDWQTMDAELDADGLARLGPILNAQECAALTALYPDTASFRSRVVMARHGFGQGEYQYFAYPLPPLIQELRQAVYPQAARTANRWAEMLGTQPRFPASLDDMLERCHAAGQMRPTPLMLKYGPGDYNCLHQDLYGEHVFPLQLVILLSDPASFEGGEFVITEQRPRMQSRAEVLRLDQGEAALFAVNERPRRGSRGCYRVKMRHGVSRLRQGERMTLGVIFHDAA